MKNKKGLWRLSPSSLYGFTECKSCFWVDNNYKRAPMFPLLLNNAMDSISKNRYDRYRKKDTFPPEALELEKEGIKPYKDLDQLENWRNSFTALKVVNEKVGYELRGRLDDVCVEPDGRLIPLDYKSSGNAPSEDKQKYYRDQLAAYGFMLENQGHKVSDRAYLLHYFPANKQSPNIRVQFSGCVDLVDIGKINIKKKLKDMVELLDGEYPGHNPDCKNCCYRQGYVELVNNKKYSKNVA